MLFIDLTWTSHHYEITREMKGLDDFVTSADLVHPDMADIIILRKVLVFLELSNWADSDRRASHIPDTEVRSIFNPCAISPHEVKYV